MPRAVDAKAQQHVGHTTLAALQRLVHREQAPVANVGDWRLPQELTKAVLQGTYRNATERAQAGQAQRLVQVRFDVIRARRTWLGSGVAPAWRSALE